MTLCQKKYWSKNLLPLDAIVMALLDTVEGKHHQCKLDHIYKSANFFEAANNHEKKYLLLMLQVKEWEALRHALNKRDWDKKGTYSDQGNSKGRTFKGESKTYKTWWR